MNIILILIVFTTTFELILCEYKNRCFQFDTSDDSNNFKNQENHTRLKLTPYIESGKIEDAQSMASVNLEGFEDVKSYAGYFTVNEKYDSNLFFWYFVAEEDPKNAPVVLWLQGGPGIASTLGIFYINGPFEYKNGVLTKRYHSWHKKYHMIYIDNPVGTGYSYTDGGYADNQTEIGNDLYKALIQFFKLFPDLKNNDFYATGESYAGKYIPAVSYAIHNNNNNNPELKINLKGFAIGNGYTHPIMQLLFGDFLYKIGYTDQQQYFNMKNIENTLVQHIKNEQWNEAVMLYQYTLFTFAHALIVKDEYKSQLFIHNLLKNSDSNTLLEFFQIIESQLSQYVHAKRITFPMLSFTLTNIRNHLMYDKVRSMAHVLSELLSHYRAVIYSGQLDLHVSFRTTEDYLMNLTFSGCEEFRDNRRKLWIVDGELAGYSKNGGNLTTVLLRNAGHAAPMDQPKWAMDMMEKLTKDIPF